MSAVERKLDEIAAAGLHHGKAMGEENLQQADVDMLVEI